MTTATANATPLAPTRSDRSPSLARLTSVEVRKMTDTRAGFWLLVSVVVLTIGAVAALGIFADADDQRLRDTLGVAVAPASILLPIIGILLMSSEWSQRTAQITFTLVPRRPRVVIAKLLAGVVLALAALAICLPVAAVATAISSPDVAHVWSLPIGLLGQTALSLVAGMITGIAFGAALLASAPAIVVYFALPLAWTGIGQLKPFEDAARWLDGSRSLSPLTEHLMSGTEWARAGATLAVWLLVPLLIGLWRITREEVR